MVEEYQEAQKLGIHLNDEPIPWAPFQLQGMLTCGADMTSSDGRHRGWPARLALEEPTTSVSPCQDHVSKSNPFPNFRLHGKEADCTN